MDGRRLLGRIVLCPLLVLLVLAATMSCSRGSHLDTAERNQHHNDLSSTPRKLQDFDWGITPTAGYPIISFDDTTATSEVVFRYNYTGNAVALDTVIPDTTQKFFAVQVLQRDCIVPGDGGITLAQSLVNGTDDTQLNVELDIQQSSIENSVYYSTIDESMAKIRFCIRVNYEYQSFDGTTTSVETMNFYETKVTITVDLTADFGLGMDLYVDLADQALANAKVTYPVDAYICDDSNTLIESPPALSQGSALQLCVRVDQNVSTDVYVKDILFLDLSQPAATVKTKSTPILQSVPDVLTSKICQGGICNVKTQVPSKFFTINEDNILAQGIAVLAFGIPPSPSTRRNLRYIDPDKTRFLQQTAETLFGKDVTLAGTGLPNEPPEVEVASSDLKKSLIISMVGAAGLALAAFIINMVSLYIRRRKRKYWTDKVDGKDDDKELLSPYLTDDDDDDVHDRDASVIFDTRDCADEWRDHSASVLFEVDGDDEEDQNASVMYEMDGNEEHQDQSGSVLFEGGLYEDYGDRPRRPKSCNDDEISLSIDGGDVFQAPDRPVSTGFLQADNGTVYYENDELSFVVSANNQNSQLLPTDNVYD